MHPLHSDYLQPSSYNLLLIIAYSRRFPMHRFYWLAAMSATAILISHGSSATLFFGDYMAGAVIEGTTWVPQEGASTDAIQKASASVKAADASLTAAYAAPKIIGLVSEARIALIDSQQEEAVACLKKAHSELVALHEVHNYVEMMDVSFGQLLYGADSHYYLPVAENIHAARAYESDLLWTSNRATAVRSADLISVHLMIDFTASFEYLRVAQKAIAADDPEEADKALSNLLHESVQDIAVVEQPQVRLKDNIYLTHVLIRQQSYNGARYTLHSAKAALEDYREKISDAGMLAKVDTLAQEIDSLDTTIDRHDPLMIRNAGYKVDEWWSDPELWSPETTS
jgi:hypothetical protein